MTRAPRPSQRPAGRRGATSAPDRAPRGERRPPTFWRDFAIAVGALIAGTLLAELFGAVDLGTALTFGTIAFMATIIGLILARGPRTPGGGQA